MMRLILISRDLLVDGQGQPRAEAVRSVVRLHRAGRQVMLLAPRPERWHPTRNRMDNALHRQRLLHEALTRGGGDLDGVCYLDYGLFTRQRRRQAELSELAARYGIKVEDLVGVSGQERELNLILGAGGSAHAVGLDNPPPGARGHASLDAAINALIQD